MLGSSNRMVDLRPTVLSEAVGTEVVRQQSWGAAARLPEQEPLLAVTRQRADQKSGGARSWLSRDSPPFLLRAAVPVCAHTSSPSPLFDASRCRFPSSDSCGAALSGAGALSHRVVAVLERDERYRPHVYLW